MRDESCLWCNNSREAKWDEPCYTCILEGGFSKWEDIEY